MNCKKIISMLLVVAMLLSCTACVNQNPQGEGASLSFPEDYKIVATSVATCEILEALGVESQHIVGVPQSDAYEIPQAYEDATSVGSPMAPDMEIIKSLDPDCIFSPNSLEGELKQQYDNIGVESYFLNLKSVEGMYESIKEIGDMLGKSEEAKKLLEDFEQFKKDYEAGNYSDNPPRVLILMGLPGSYVVATESSYVGNLVKLAGAENIYGDGDGADFVNVNVEDMLAKNPDIILRTSHAMPQQVALMFEEEFNNNDIWKHFDAVKNGKVYDLDNEKCGMSATFKYKDALNDLKPLLYN